MRVALVAMPWALFDAPSAALGSLAAVLRRDRPHFTVDCIPAHVEMWSRLEDVYEALCAKVANECLFVPLLYPETAEAAFRRFATMEVGGLPPDAVIGSRASDQGTRNCFERILTAARETVCDTVERLAGHYDLVGFTIAYSQLFASLAVARELKARQPQLRIVFGGAEMDGPCGASVLREYPFVDFVVRGEGELTLLDLCDALVGQVGPAEVPEVPGVLTRSRGEEGIGTDACSRGRPVSELDSLPVPDYREYAELAERRSILWHVPVETSRGCWWNRSRETRDPLRACYFCNLNLTGYREKTLGRVRQEIEELTSRYANVRLRLMDNVVRKRGLIAMLETLRDLGRDLRFLVEVRAEIRPYELLLLLEAGCDHLQIGVEGLSSTYLRRIGKGTTTIQNLQAMKTCEELGIQSCSNLLIGFPGATQEEVEETVRNIRDYAIAFEPMNDSHYCLGVGSSVERLPERFGVSNLRNFGQIADVLPSEVAGRLSLHILDFDSQEQADWRPVQEAIRDWKRLRQSIPNDSTFSNKPLYYTDGGTFLEIVDRRAGFRLITLDAFWREVYLFCMEIRTWNQICEQSVACTKSKIREVLDGLVAEKLMFSERERYLSLAPAVHPLAAARRIRQARAKYRRVDA